MSVKVMAPLGITEVTAHGLIQWDYGQQLEVTCPGLPSLVEVHFACKGMSEAVVRSCSVSADGTLTAVVPDVCLEQTTPVYAWVVVVDEASSTTVLTVILPITERIRPATSPSEVPEEISNRYTEAIAAINEQIGRLASGDVIVARATQADTADRAKCDEWGNNLDLDYAKEQTLLSGGMTVARAKFAKGLSSPATLEMSSDYEGFVVSSPGIYMVAGQYSSPADGYCGFSAVIAIHDIYFPAQGSSIVLKTSSGDMKGPSLVYSGDINPIKNKILYLDGADSLLSVEWTLLACYQLASF